MGKHFFYLFIWLLPFLVVAQERNTYECFYQLEVSNAFKNADSKDFIPSTIKVSYRIVTDGNWYLVHAKSTSVNLAFQEMKSLSNEEDSFLIKRTDKLIYMFSDKTVSELTFQTLSAKVDTLVSENKQLLTQKTVDSAFFFIDAFYPALITPFPQFTGNIHGVTKMKSKNLVCTLLSKRAIQVDFKKYYELVKNYVKSGEIVGLPF